MARQERSPETRSGQTSPRPACAAHGPISRQVPPCRCARTPPPLRVRHPANDAGGGGVDPRWVAWQERSPETRCGQTSPVPRARRAAPSHGRRLHAAALALHRRPVHATSRPIPRPHTTHRTTHVRACLRTCVRRCAARSSRRRPASSDRVRHQARLVRAGPSREPAGRARRKGGEEHHQNLIPTCVRADVPA